MNQKRWKIEDVLSWVVLGLGLVAIFILDSDDAPRKWHAATLWTMIATYGVLLWGREKWRSASFWCFWVTCLILHTLAMWAIFGKLLPGLVLGTLYVIPLAFIESVALAVLYFRLDRKLRNQSN
jgi:hypothetical protein